MNNTKLKFDKLTPISKADLDIYNQAFDFIFKDNEIKNVAISGPYGAGKSSLLETYKSIHGEKKFIHVSLAHFNENESIDQSDTANNRDDTILEGKILNQLLHQISAKNIPQTNFKTKTSLTNKEIVLATTMIATLIATICFLANEGAVKTYMSLLFKEKEFYNNLIIAINYLPLLLTIASAVIVIYFIYLFVSTQKNKKIFSKLNIHGNEIEIFSEDKDSFFDKYLNEVLYLFENVEADVIVFEDIDRFPGNRIFERLREINMLANVHRAKSRKKSVKFFYLIRDDIFTSKDRTKFFDYILPVIPVIDSSNSYNQFISHLEKNNIFDKFDKVFLQSISLYVDDMRLLKNICNEFLIYFNRLKIVGPNYNKMLAMMIYKNIFPRDYSDLQLNRGFVFSVLEQRNKLIVRKKASIDEKIKRLQVEIDAINNEVLENIQDLDYIEKGKRTAANNIQNYYEKQAALKEVESWKSTSYPIRKNNIEFKANGRVSRNKKEIEKLSREKKYVETMTLSTLLTKDISDNIFNMEMKDGKISDEFEKIKSDKYFDLLKFLLIDGYIEKDYSDYMTYFYENSLSRVDKIFLRSIRDRKALPFDYELTDPEKVIEMLKPTDMYQEEILNFDLVFHILNMFKGSEFERNLIDHLNDKENFEFIRSYFMIVLDYKLMVDALNRLWPSFIEEAFGNNALTEEITRKYIENTIMFASPNVLLKVNENKVLTDYISDCDDFINIDFDTNHIIHQLELIGISFKRLTEEIVNEEMLKAVYTKSLYNLNFHNIAIMLRKIHNFSNEEEICKSNYSLVCKDITSPLYNYIHSNFKAYMDIYLENCKGEITDKSHIILEVLNNEKATVEQREAYLSLCLNSIEHINSVTNKNLWTTIVSQRKIIISEKNVMNYFIEKGFDDAIVGCINYTDYKFDYDNNELGFSDKEKEKLFHAVLICNSLNNEAYESLVCSLNYYFSDFNIKNINLDKMKILIDNNVVNMNKKSLLFIRENYSKIALYYIEKNIELYVDIMDNVIFSQDELDTILELDVENNIKFKLLAFSNKKISIVGKNYDDEINEYILKNNLFEDDINYLFTSYDYQTPNIREVIFEYAINNIKFTVNNLGGMSEILFKQILASDKVEYSVKIKLFVARMPEADDLKAITYLKILNKAEFEDIFDNSKRPRYAVNSETEAILDAFIEKGWMHEYIVDSRNENIYRIRRFPPKDEK